MIIYGTVSRELTRGLLQINQKLFKNFEFYWRDTSVKHNIELLYSIDLSVLLDQEVAPTEYEFVNTALS